MPEKPYDPVGAMGGLFAPAYIHGNPEAEAAAAQWQAENFALTPAMVEATRGPSTTVHNPATGGMGQAIRGAGTTTTIPGSVDPAALKILAQGGKYNPQRDAIAQVIANGAGTPASAAPAPAGGAGRSTMAPSGGFSMMRQPTGPVPAGMQRAYSPLEYLMGEGDNTGFMQGSFGGGA